MKIGGRKFNWKVVEADRKDSEQIEGSLELSRPVSSENHRTPIKCGAVMGGGKKKNKHRGSGDGCNTGSGSQEHVDDKRDKAQQPSEASSSMPSNIPTEQLQQLSLQTEPDINKAVVPASSKQNRPPLRPDEGSCGQKCVIEANHFIVTLLNKDLHQYHVSIAPVVTSRAFNRAVIKQLVSVFRASHLGGRLPVYDGGNSLYTAGPLPFSSNEFQVTLSGANDGTRAERPTKTFSVVIRFVAQPSLTHLQMFLDGGKPDAPQEALQVLDIVLRELPTARYFRVGRSFYSPNPGQKQQLGEGLELWRGFYQSIRPTKMRLSLNIDVSSTAFIEPLPVIDYVLQLLNKDARVLSRPLSDSDRAKIIKALRGVKVEVTHRHNMHRKYRIVDLTSQTTRELSFLGDEGERKTVVDHFQVEHRYTIKYTNWPCLQVGNPQRPSYLPMEVCKIAETQRYSKRLTENQRTELLKVTCQGPHERKQAIIEAVRRNEYHLDPYATEFGIRIRNELTTVEARVLAPPQLKYHDSGKMKFCWPDKGKWNMSNKKMINGGSVSNWTCINFDQNVRESDIRRFCNELAKICRTSGMKFASEPVIQPSIAQPDQVEMELKAHHCNVTRILQQQHKELDLLIAILPNNNGSLYGDLKRICETELGLISQCCLAKHVYTPKIQYLANVALKINVKVGGRNTVLADALSKEIPLVTDKPTIIFGADVTHPHPGDSSSPSIAAVVASQDWPEITKYAGLVCAQAHRQERIEELFKSAPDPGKGNASGGMIRELLQSFKIATGMKPERIIFFRDGVSEGQFYQVLSEELDAIRRACSSLELNYQPPITFVVVQKRHRTRLFPNTESSTLVDNSENIHPGTVVDSTICHPTEFDFYLCSHAGIKGTSRPAHYHVLWDDNEFSADNLQTLINNLCYTYARCTRAVSIVPPAYYAHLAAFRARFYMEREPSDGDSVTRSNRRADNQALAVRPLPALKDNVKKVMFFC